MHEGDSDFLRVKYSHGRESSEGSFLKAGHPKWQLTRRSITRSEPGGLLGSMVLYLFLNM